MNNTTHETQPPSPSTTEEKQPHQSYPSSSTTEEKQPHQSSQSSSTTEEKQPHQSYPSSSTTEEKQPHQSSPSSSPTEENQPHQPSSSSSPPASIEAPSSSTTKEKQPHQPSSSSSSPASIDDAEKWGTHIMGSPAEPSSHPNNQKAALWKAGNYQQPQLEEQHPYVQHSPVNKPSKNPLEPVLHVFNFWGKSAETLACNIWQNLKMGPSVSEAAWGKLNLTAKAITGGGFESLYKQTFTNDPNEKLKKTFACYLSTATGPVAGTLYLSNLNAAFCSDRPLSFIAPSGQEAWSYYKVMVPLAKISTANPVSMIENPSEKYIQIVTIDGHDFWFMGFVNFEKASRHLSDSMSEFTAKNAQHPVII